MKLGDVMSAMELHVYAEVAMVMFMAMFVMVVLHVVRRSNATRFEQARFMPLDDDNPVSPRHLDEDQDA